MASNALLTVRSNAKNGSRRQATPLRSASGYNTHENKRYAGTSAHRPSSRRTGMSCQKCGEPCQGELCSTCEQIQANEKQHGESVDERDPWDIIAGDDDA